MKNLITLITLTNFVAVSTSFGQTSTSYSLTRLIGQLNSSVSISTDTDGSVHINDSRIASKLNSANIDRIEKFSKRNQGVISSNEPILLQFDQNIDVQAKIAELTATGLFKFIEPDYIGGGQGVCTETPNDAHFVARQWGLRNDGTFNATSVADGDIDMDHAWSITQGSSSIIVGILDSGIKPDHPEFAGRIWTNPSDNNANGADDDGNGYTDDNMGWDFANNDSNPTDDHGHGTNVTGIIGANGGNGIGYSGVDWNCKLMTCKVLNSSNNGLYSWWISGIYYLVDNGADVINMSLVGFTYSAGMETAVNYAHSNNIPIVAAMGNGNSNFTYYPAGYANVIAIGATDTDNERADPFTWGGGSSYGNHIDFSAPGNYIYGLAYNSNTNYNTYWGGTSQATPLVTGLISLMKGMDNSLTIAEIRALLTSGCVDGLGKPSEDTPGWDQYHGHGMVNAYTTLQQVNIGVDVQTACSSFTWIDGNTYTSNNNTATHVVLTSGGCDSLVRLNLTMVNNTTYGTDIQANCGAFTWIDGNTYTSNNNTASYTLTNATGCDSVVTLNLTIIQPNTAVDANTACSSFTWIDGNTYTSNNNTATHTLTNVAGCDSVVTLNLTIIQPNTAVDVNTACSSFTWIDGNTYTSNNNTATHTLTNVAGCDSVVTLNLTIIQPNSGVDVRNACSSFTWIDGNTYTSNNNTATYTLSNAAGCDSIVTLNLIISQPNSGVDVRTACTSLTWIDGNTYTSNNNTATYTLSNAAGCDSIVTLNLTMTSQMNATDTQSACTSFDWMDGNTYTSNNTTATWTIASSQGCDSVITLNLTIFQPSSSSISVTAVDTYTAPSGAIYTTSGIYTDIIPNANGCDSVITIDLQLNQTGIEENFEDALHVYPNPVAEVMSVAVLDQLIGTAYTIADASGRIVLSGNLEFQVNTIDVAQLVNGIYFLQIPKHSAVKIAKQ